MKKNTPSNMKESSLFVLSGDSAILKTRALESIVQQRLPDGDREYGLVQLQAAEASVSEITSALGSGSLFATQQVVVIRELDKMARTQQQQLVASLENMGPELTVAITCSPSARGKSTEPNLSAPLVRLAKSSGQIIDCHSPIYTEWKDELTPWVREEANYRGKSLATNAAQLLIDTVGSDCDRLASEISKLVVYVGDSPEINGADIRAAASSGEEQDIFGLTDAIGQRDVAAALTHIPALLPAHAPRGSGLPVLAMISRHLRLLWQSNYLQANSVNLLSAHGCPEHIKQRLPVQHNIFDAVRGRRPIARRFSEQGRNFTQNQLARGLVEIYQTDMALKGHSNQVLDDRAQLELLVVSLCTL
jgi:DNA polymerase-3 subunit delta